MACSLIKLPTLESDVVYRFCDELLRSKEGMKQSAIEKHASWRRTASSLIASSRLN